MTGGQLLLKSLDAVGIRTVFGMPGTQNLAIYDALHSMGGRFAHYLVSNEQAATMMAGGFARVSGRIAAALTVPGPGATNASTGVADALNDCVPLLLITGGVDRPLARRDRSKLFHGLDGDGYFRAISRFYACPQTAAEIPETVAAAYRAMRGVRPGPAVIEIPPDVAAESSDAAPLDGPVAVPDAPAPAGADLHAAISAIRALRRPVVWVGGDVMASDACLEACRLAEHLGAPVIHTRLGKGAIADDHHLNFGNSRHFRARQVLTEADGLISVGVRFAQIDTRNWTVPIPACHVQLDRDPRELGRELPAQVGVAGNLRESLEAIRSGLPSGSSEWDRRLREIRAAWVRPRVPVLAEIREVLGRSDILVCDITSLSYRMFDEYPVYEPRTVAYPCHFVTMGYGFPAALGARVAHPDRHVVALCGDGGFLMSMGELSTMAQYGIAAAVVVVCDGALTAIAASQKLHYGGRTVDVGFPSPDFVALAASFGIAGYRATRVEQLPDLLRHVLHQGKPGLIEIGMATRREEVEGQIPWLHGE
jgi:acetolactate synthase-1/2/3 large subunit